MACNKRVSDPFNEKVRLRIFESPLMRWNSSTSSSGSEHDGEYDVVVSPSCSPSPCLSYLVQNFLEEEEEASNNTTDPDYGSDSDSDNNARPDPTTLIRTSVINPTMNNNVDSFRDNLLAQVSRAEKFTSIFPENKPIFLRNLMAYLREIGYNAGVCKTKWNSSGNLTAGNYEFLDVNSPEKGVRYIIDMEFSGEFEIARETDSYKKLRSSLPRIFVGKPEELKKILRVMSDEARRSMKMNGLTLAPWRKHRYMQMKWLGPYRRSTSHSPAPVSLAVGSGFPVKCRAVGFDVGGGCDGGRIFVPTVGRTR